MQGPLRHLNKTRPGGERVGAEGCGDCGELDAGTPLAGRFKMTRDRALLIFMIILMIALIMAIKVLAGERSPSDWFALSARSSKRISNNGRFQT